MEKPLSGLIDSHMHIIEMQKKGIDAELTIKKCFENKMHYLLDAGTSLENFSKRKALAEKFPDLYLSAGVYPSFSDKEITNPELDMLCDQLNDGKTIALGEIGLDWHRNYSTKDKQIRLFIKQLEVAEELQIPVIIHCRDAEEEIYTILSSFDLGNLGVMHCFSSNLEWAKKFIGLGLFISFSGSVTYKNSKLIQEACMSIPLSKLLIETDSPYLPPQVLRGELNTPLNIIHTYKFISDLRNIEMEELIQQVKKNFELVFFE